jgi:NAD+ synthase (glutamine-hydrolysing)
VSYFLYLLKHCPSIIESVPTAELRPLQDGQVVQTDEDEIGLTYDELAIIGKIRRPGCSGPYRMFLNLVTEWYPKYSYQEVCFSVLC